MIPLRLPVLNESPPGSDSGYSTVSVSVPAEMKALIAIPASTIVYEVEPVYAAAVYTSIIAISAPEKAAIGNSILNCGNTVTQSTAINRAPELTPIILGPASGLCRTV